MTVFVSRSSRPTHTGKQNGTQARSRQGPTNSLVQWPGSNPIECSHPSGVASVRARYNGPQEMVIPNRWLHAAGRRLVIVAALSSVTSAADVSPRHDAAQAEPRRTSISHVARAVQPGEVVLVRVTTSSPAETVTGDLASGPLHFYRMADPLAWEAVMGLDLDTKAGPFRLTIRTVYGGTTADVQYGLTVTPKRFPARRITVDERFVNPPASELPRIEREARRTAAILAIASPSRLWDGPFLPPVPGQATSSFGRINIINGLRRSPHTGTDFQAAVGTPVEAPNAGTVVLSEPMYYSGDAVIIDHGLGVFSFLAHLSRRDVAAGDHVSAGTVVGLSGVTGRITGPHLHWSVRVAGARVDPISMLDVLGHGAQRLLR